MSGQRRQDDGSQPTAEPTSENITDAVGFPDTLHLFPGADQPERAQRGGSFRLATPVLLELFPSGSFPSNHVADAAASGAMEQQAADQAKRRLVPQPPAPWPLPIPAGQPGGILETLELRLGEPPSSAPVEKCVADLALLRAYGGDRDPPKPSPPARLPDDRCWACNDKIGSVVVLRASPVTRVLVCRACHRIGAFWYADWKERHHHH